MERYNVNKTSFWRAKFANLKPPPSRDIRWNKKERRRKQHIHFVEITWQNLTPNQKEGPQKFTPSTRRVRDTICSTTCGWVEKCSHDSYAREANWGFRLRMCDLTLQKKWLKNFQRRSAFKHHLHSWEHPNKEIITHNLVIDQWKTF